MNELLEPSPTPLDLTFRLFRTPVRVSVWFWILPGALGGWMASSSGVPYLFLAVSCFFFSVLLHEFGHVFAGRGFGQGSYVVLNAIGGVAIGCADVFERWQRIFAYAAGPGVQLLAAGVLYGIDCLIGQHFPLMETDYPLVTDAVATLIGINLVMAFINMIPLSEPLDGWYIVREIREFNKGNHRAPWEVDANWWRKGADWSGQVEPPDWNRNGAGTNRLPLLILAGVVVLGLGWQGRQMYRDSKIVTATDLMEEFKKDPDRAMERFWLRKVSFKAVLRKPPWEEDIIQYEGGDEAAVYFVTKTPGEWLFCVVPYDEKLRQLKEGTEYRVSGTVFHFDREGKLFLDSCTVKDIPP